MKKTATVINLGCPKNQVDSEVITGILARQFEITEDPALADIIVVNTCGFIETAKEESINAICEMINLKDHGKCRKVYATGCLAQRYGRELLEQLPELDGVLGDGDLEAIVLNIDQSQDQRIHTHKDVQDFLYNHQMPRVLSGANFFAYVKIAEGCDNCCSYCAIPGIKGRYRSRKMESVLEEVKQLAQQGVKEIAFVAQDTTRYGTDLYNRLALPELLRQIVTIDEIQWVRLLYCYPDAFTDDLIDVIAAEPKICKYVDIPLQHADNSILAAMNRRNTAEQAEALIDKLRSKIPGITLRSTFITGFPGETEEQFQSLVQFVQRNRFERLGVFAYSQEENTPAGRRDDQVPAEIRHERKERLMEIQTEISYTLNQLKIGQSLNVILEEEMSDQYWAGRTEGDAPEIDGQVYLGVEGKHRPGDIVLTRITKADYYDLEGEGYA